MSVAAAPPDRAPESVQKSRPEPTFQSTPGPMRELSWAPDPVGWSPSSRDLENERLPRRNRVAAFFVGLLAFLFIAAATFVVVRSLGSSAAVGVSNPFRPVGTLMSTSTPGTNQLQVRTPAGRVIFMAVAGKRLVTADGYSLAVTSFQPGDTVSETSGAVLVNRSQRRVSILGRVAMSPDPNGNVMTVQLTPTRTILIDIGSTTQINGDLPSVSSRMSIQEADQVRIVGIQDTTLDEITQTVSIDRIAVAGPAGLR